MDYKSNSLDTLKYIFSLLSAKEKAALIKWLKRDKIRQETFQTNPCKKNYSILSKTFNGGETIEFAEVQNNKTTERFGEFHIFEVRVAYYEEEYNFTLN